MWASIAVACELRSTGLVVEAHGLSCSVAWEILPDQGIKAASPALAGGFLTDTPGKPRTSTCEGDTPGGTFATGRYILSLTSFCQSLVQNDGLRFHFPQPAL